MEDKRVVVTGIGVVCPVGLDVAATWQSLVAGKSGIGSITEFDATEFDVRIGGEVRGFDPTAYMTPKEARRMDRFTQYAIAAMQEAVTQSRLEVTAGNAFDIGVIYGSGVGGIRTYAEEHDVMRDKGPRRVSPLLVPMITTDVPAVQIALRTGARGPNMGVSTACATGADAIGHAYETIRRGHAQAMFTGGVEAALTPIAVATFDRMRALSRRNDDPAGASRPFDAGRDGFVIGEGGGVLILEELGFALGRGAEPLAELVAYAATSDAIHIAAPDAEGTGAAHCMALAMRRAGITPEEVSYINAHGTSTVLGDVAETKAIKEALGDHARRVAISSTKSMTGHLLGGAGAVEAAVCIQALRTSMIPPTINLLSPDPDCDLDYVPNQARAANLRIAMSNSLGFGGHNSTLIFRRFP